MQTLESPSPDILAHSAKLATLLRQMIHDNGPIDFATFMQTALYAPGLGYYTAQQQQFGAQGDFVTAPHISSLFSATLANAIAPNLTSESVILELGPGNGQMACDILKRLDTLNQLPKTYYLLELSPALQALQRETLEKNVPHLLERAEWLTTLPKNIDGVIVANEVLDAMPVNLFALTDDGIKERFVTLKDEQLVFENGEPSTAVLSAVEKLPNIKAPYISEVNLFAAPWIQSLKDCLTRGTVFLIDYGFTEKTYYHPQRNTGTLMCHYRHHNHPDPFYLPGCQDITAHVDFTHVMEAAEKAGFTIADFNTQANFLIENGITTLCEERIAAHPEDTPALSKQLQTLLFPHEMGELFQVLTLTL